MAVVDLSPALTAPLPAAAVHAIFRLERALAAPAEALAAKVGKTLGFHQGWKPRDYLGETATYITMWTQRELNDVYERVGGTVTTRQVQRSACDGDVTWDAIEITLTVNLPGIGRVEIVTDWDEDTGGHDLPVIRAIQMPQEIASATRATEAQQAAENAKYLRDCATASRAA